MSFAVLRSTRLIGKQSFNTPQRNVILSQTAFPAARQTRTLFFTKDKKDMPSQNVTKQILAQKQFQKDYQEPSHIPSLEGPFGTMKEPVLVPSAKYERVVGCMGGPGNQHEILWHVVRSEKPTICLECGQVFKLVRDESATGGAHH